MSIRPTFIFVKSNAQNYAIVGPSELRHSISYVEGQILNKLSFESLGSDEANLSVVLAAAMKYYELQCGLEDGEKS